MIKQIKNLAKNADRILKMKDKIKESGRVTKMEH